MASGGPKDGDLTSDDTMGAATTPAVPATKLSVGDKDVSVDATMASASTGQSTAGATVVRGGDYVDLTPVDPKHYLVGKEIAKGGMGRILAARDRRLGRPVAIKELLVRGGDFRQRFEREARITARLQHPAIVNLLEAGTWPSGEPFYAMKLVAGRSMDDVIKAATTLDARLALLPNVIAVVDALAYAHSQRVIHRDLKPANVLVGDFGETVVIDWGLAKDLADTSDSLPDLAAGPFRTGPAAEGQTVAGSVMGTPAYMPEEQARGATVDERADVYALGAILYHVLAGAPPYTGNSADEILDKVIAGPPLPIAASGAPLDLVTIVNKAMAHDAAARYPTAQELAVDLKRFQTGQLVGAHRYSNWQLVRRWVRRNKAAVSVAGVLLAVMAVTSTIAVRRIIQERDTAKEQRALAEQNRLVAEERKTEADTRRAAAEKLVEFMVLTLKDRLEPVGKLDLLEGVGTAILEYYESTGDDAGASIEARSKRASALFMLGEVEASKGNMDESLRLHRAAFAIRERLAAEHPDDGSRQIDVAAAQRKIGTAYLEKGELDSAGNSYAAALERSVALAAQDPSNDEWQRDLGVSHEKVGNLASARGSWDEARRAHLAALEIRRKLHAKDPANAQWERDLAVSESKMGGVELELGHDVAAIGHFTASRDGFTSLAEKDPDHVPRQRDLAWGWISLGDAQASVGNQNGAIQSFRQSLAITENNVQRDPQNSEWSSDLATSLDRLGAAERQAGNIDEALRIFRRAVEIFIRLVDEHPEHGRFGRDLGVSQTRVASVLWGKGDLAGAEAAYLEAHETYARLAVKSPDDALMMHHAGGVLRALGDIAAEQDQFEKARTYYTSSLLVRERLVRKTPDSREAVRALASTHSGLCNLAMLEEQHAEALAPCVKALELREQILEKSPENPKSIGDVAVSLEMLGDIYRAKGDLAAARSAHERSLALRKQLYDTDPENLRYMASLGVSHERLGEVEMAAGNSAESIAAFRKSLLLYERASSKDSGTKERRIELAIGYYKLAHALRATDPRESRTLAARGAAVVDKLRAEGLLTPYEKSYFADMRKKLVAAR